MRPILAAELVRLKVDVIVAVATQPTHGAVNPTSTIPIVFTLVGDPVGQGVVSSLAHPGGNATGLSTLSLDITPKWLELLNETVPEVSRVALLWNPSSSFEALSVRETEVAARALGVQLQILGVRGPDEFDSAFEAMTRERAGALLVVPDVQFVLHRTRLADLAAKNHLPAMYGLATHVEAGGLISYGTNYADLFRRAAHYVDKILKGAKPSDIPIEQPTKFELVINLKTANQLGVTIPPSILYRADKVLK